jgi:hypothetical protein
VLEAGWVYDSITALMRAERRRRAALRGCAAWTLLPAANDCASYSSRCAL